LKVRSRNLSERERARRSKQREQTPVGRMGLPPDDRPGVIPPSALATTSVTACRALDPRPPRSQRRAEPDCDALKLIRKSEVARHLGVSPWTVDRWVKAGTFPRPIFVSDRAPARWRVVDVAAWLDRRKTARRKRPQPQGRLKSASDR
jgi:predicted DNA-binding transcriptional regulator AlpA